MHFFTFLRESFRGKTIGRILLFSALLDLFSRDRFLQEAYTVLELGSAIASHQRAFPSSWRMTYSNYVHVTPPALCIDVTRPFSLPSGAYGGVVAFNLLYAIDDYMHCLSESLRVAKYFVLFNIPVVSGLAPHPNDFNRFTIDRLRTICSHFSSSLGIQYEIIPFGGSWSSAVSCIDVYLRFRIVKIPFYALAFFLDRCDAWISRDCPLQYVVLMKKNFHS